MYNFLKFFGVPLICVVYYGFCFHGGFRFKVLVYEVDYCGGKRFGYPKPNQPPCFWAGCVVVCHHFYGRLVAHKIK